MNSSSRNGPPRGSPSRKKPTFTFNLLKCSFYIERDITNLSFEILFLFQTDMFRNYLNFIKSKLNFRCFKQIGGFGGTSRKKVPLGIKKQIPQTSSNRKSYSSFFSLLKEEKLMRNWKFYLQQAFSDSGIKRSFIVR